MSPTPEDDVKAARPWRDWVLVALSLVLLASAGRKLAGGFYDLTASRAVRPTVGPPVDLRYRWVEWHYVFGRGVDPFDVYLWDQAEGPVEAAKSSPGAGRPDAGLGPVVRAPYPPWFYPPASPVLAWGWPAARAMMAVANAAGFAVLVGLAAWFAWRRGRWPVALFCGSLALAAAQHYTVLRLGQPAVVVVALLAAALVFMSRRRGSRINSTVPNAAAAAAGPSTTQPDPRLPPRRRGFDLVAGLLLGLAMLKPTLAVPFVVVVVVRRRWWTLAACVGLVAVCSAVTWARTGVDPLTMTRQMQAIGEQIETRKGLADGIADGPVLWLEAAGLGSAAATRAAGLAVLAVLAAALVAARRRPIWVAFALAALAAQLWTHHKPYDEVALLLLVLPATAILLTRWRRGGGGRRRRVARRGRRGRADADALRVAARLRGSRVCAVSVRRLARRGLVGRGRRPAR